MVFMTTLDDTVDYMTSGSYEERFIAEYAQLAIRTNKLAAMIAKHDKNALEFTPATPIVGLKAQLCVMNDYLEILEKRAKIEEIELPEVTI